MSSQKKKLLVPEIVETNKDSKKCHLCALEVIEYKV